MVYLDKVSRTGVDCSNGIGHLSGHVVEYHELLSPHTGQASCFLVYLHTGTGVQVEVQTSVQPVLSVRTKV